MRIFHCFRADDKIKYIRIQASSVHRAKENSKALTVQKWNLYDTFATTTRATTFVMQNLVREVYVLVKGGAGLRALPTRVLR